MPIRMPTPISNLGENASYRTKRFRIRLPEAAIRDPTQFIDIGRGEHVKIYYRKLKRIANGSMLIVVGTGIGIGIGDLGARTASPTLFEFQRPK